MQCAQGIKHHHIPHLPIVGVDIVRIGGMCGQFLKQLIALILRHADNTPRDAAADVENLAPSIRMVQNDWMFRLGDVRLVQA